MKEVLAGLPAHRQPSGDVSARSEPALHGIADGHIFVLHLFAHGDAFFVVGFGDRAALIEVRVSRSSWVRPAALRLAAQR